MVTIRRIVTFAGILVIHAAVPADTITVDGTVYEGVYVSESSARWIICFPDDGSTLSVRKDEVDAKDIQTTVDLAERDALYTRWQARSKIVKTSKPTAAAAPGEPIEPSVAEEMSPKAIAEPRETPIAPDDGEHGIAEEAQPATIQEETAAESPPGKALAPLPDEVLVPRDNTTEQPALSADSAGETSAISLQDLRTVDIARIGVLAVLALAAGGLGRFIVQTLIGMLFAGGILYSSDWNWVWSLTAGLAGGYLVLAFPFLLMGMTSRAGAVLMVLAALAFGLPAALASHYWLESAWPRAALEGAVLMSMLPVGILRTLVVTGVVKRPEPQKTDWSTVAAKPSTPQYQIYASSAPEVRARSEMRTPPDTRRY